MRMEKLHTANCAYNEHTRCLPKPELSSASHSPRHLSRKID